MDEESVLAPEAGPETVATEQVGGEIEGQVETPTAEGEDPEEQKKSEAAKRRERQKAWTARLQSEHQEAMKRAEEAERRKAAILAAGQNEAPPKEADFPDPVEYAAAKAIWGAEQRVRAREANGAGEVAEAAKREAEEIRSRASAIIEQGWVAQLEEAKSRYADFEAVALRGWEPSPAMTDLIKTSDQGADLAYYLGKNRALAAQIAAMNPVEAARQLGRIEAGLTAPKPRTETNAPPPISPVRGTAGASRDPAKMSVSEYAAWRANGGKVG